MKIKLSEVEMEVATMLGQIRRAVSLKHDWKNRRDWTEDGAKNESESCAGEMAVAKALNIYPQFELSLGDSPVPKFDLKWERRRLEVKSTQWTGGKLLIPYLNEDLIYFLVRGEGGDYDVVGYIKGEDVKEKGNYGDQKHHSCWCIEPQVLVPYSPYMKYQM